MAVDFAKFATPFRWSVVDHGNDKAYAAMLRPPLTDGERAAVDPCVDPSTCVPESNSAVCRVLHRRTVAVFVKGKSPIVLVDRHFREIGDQVSLAGGSERVEVVAVQPTFGGCCVLRALHFVPVVVGLRYVNDMCPALDVNRARLNAEWDTEVLPAGIKLEQTTRLDSVMRDVREQAKQRNAVAVANEADATTETRDENGRQLQAVEVVVDGQANATRRIPRAESWEAFLQLKDDNGKVGTSPRYPYCSVLACVLHCLLRHNQVVWNAVRPGVNWLVVHDAAWPADHAEHVDGGCAAPSARPRSFGASAQRWRDL